MFARGGRHGPDGHAGHDGGARARPQQRTASYSELSLDAADIGFGRGSTVQVDRKKLGRRFRRMLVRLGLLLPMILGSSAIGQQTTHTPAQRPSARSQPVAHGQAATQASSPSVAVQPSAVPQSTRQASLGTSPQRTTATYDDWVIQCETVTGASPHKRCEMAQTTQLNIQGRRQPFSRAAIIRPTKDHAGTLIIQLPVNVSLATNVRIQMGDNDAGIVTPFARCIPSGCFAELELKDETLKRFRAASAAGKISFADAASQNLSVPLSFNGFGKAYDALLRE